MPSQRKRSERRPNIDRQFRSGHQKLFDDYFADNPTYDEQTFYRRFRIPKSLFTQICDDLGRHDEFFTLRCDAAGKILGFASIDFLSSICVQKHI